MLTLLVFACLAGTDTCHFAVVAGGFVHEKQCAAYQRLMIAGWAAIHPTMEARGAICTPSPQYLLHGRAA